MFKVISLFGAIELNDHLLSEPININGVGIFNTKSIVPVFAVPSFFIVKVMSLYSSGTRSCLSIESFTKFLPVTVKCISVTIGIPLTLSSDFLNSIVNGRFCFVNDDSSSILIKKLKNDLCQGVWKGRVGGGIRPGFPHPDNL